MCNGCQYIACFNAVCGVCQCVACVSMCGVGQWVTGVSMWHFSVCGVCQYMACVMVSHTLVTIVNLYTLSSIQTKYSGDTPIMFNWVGLPASN